MSGLWGLVTPDGRLLGRVGADWKAPEGSTLRLVPPEEADALPAPRSEPLPIDPPPPASRLMSPRVFMDALPRARQTDITTAGVAVPSVLTWLLRLVAAVEVDLDDPETVEGVGALEQAGLITAEEAAALLRSGKA